MKLLYVNWAQLVLGWVTVFGRVYNLGCDKTTRSIQSSIPLGSLNWVPTLTGFGKDRNVTSAGLQVTLCDRIWHANSHSRSIQLFLHELTHRYTDICDSCTNKPHPCTIWTNHLNHSGIATLPLTLASVAEVGAGLSYRVFHDRLTLATTWSSIPLAIVNHRQRYTNAGVSVVKPDNLFTTEPWRWFGSIIVVTASIKVLQVSCSTSSPVSAWMDDTPWVGKPPHRITSHQDQTAS